MKRFVYIFLALVCCAVSVSATNVSIPGSMNNWDISASTMTLSEDATTASISYTLNAGNYEYKIAFESWSDCLSTSTTITRENNSATFSASYSGNAIFQADVTGDYMFTWTFATNTLTVTYPEAGVQQCGNDLYWSLANGTLTITGSGAMYDYSSGSAPWFNDRSSIAHVSLPEGLTHIGNIAFYDCSSLTSITIPYNVTSIGNYAFSRCFGLTQVTIPNSVTSIGDGAFYDCNGLTQVTIPNSVTSIGDDAFSDCSYLASVVIGTSVTSIGNDAFYYCYNLDYIRIDAQTPPTLGNHHSIYSSPICYVPVGTLEAYQASSWASYVSRFEECEQQITCAEAATRCLPTPSVVHYTIYGYVTELTENHSSTDNTLSFWMADMPIGGKVLYAHNVVPNATTDRTLQKGDYVKLQGYIMLHDAIPSTAEGCTMEILSAPTSNLTTQCGDSLYWMLADSTLTIVGSGMMYDYSTSAPAPWSELKNSFHTLVLPQGLTTIGDNAFADCAALQAVAIPTSVTNIGTAAFQNCTALTQVLIPEGVQHLEDNAFKGCSALATVYAQAQIPPVLGNTVFNSKPVCYVPTGGVLATYQSSTWANFATSFEEQDKKCGDNLYYLFADSTLTIVGTGEMNYYSRPWTSTAIARVFLPDGLKSIGSSAFYDSKLTSISLPNTLTTINYQAFRGCSQLTSIVLPDSITTIGQNAFYYSGIYNSTANWEDGALYIGDYLIATNSNLPATCAIKEGTRLIADYTFSGKSSSLTSVIIPESVVRIGDRAFYNCDALTYIRIPSSVKNIGRESFYDCSQLAFVDLSEGLTTIGEEAFNNCDALTHITIPSTVTSIGNSAFYNCGALNAIYLEATTPPTLGSSVFSYTSSSLKCYLACGLLGEYLASSAWPYLFSNFIEYCPSDTYHTFDYEDTNTQWQFIQSGQTNQWTIGIAAGSASMKNKSLYISNDGTSFAYDQNAASTSWAYLPVTLTTTDSIFFSWKGVGETCCDYAYAYLIPAGSLPTAGSTTLPEGAIAVGNKINQQTTWQCDTIVPNVEGNYNLCFMWTNDESSGTTSIAIDDVRIGSAIGIAANKCGDDLYWTLADSTLTITGSGAMYEYANMQMIPWYNQRNNIAYVSLPDGLTNIARNAFYNCDALRTVNIPNGVTSIGRDAFYDCDALTTITLPNTVTNIGNRVFYDCYNLSSAINIPEGVTAIGDSTFYNCNRITSITIPNTVTSIGTYAFYNCDGISDIIIPNGVTTINDYTFYNCDGFTSIIIPNSVTSIGIYAFGYCYNLASVTIGNAVSSLADRAFYNCSVLDIVYVLSQTPPALGTNALYSTPLCYIPAGTLAAYQASDWANYVSGFVEQGQCGDNLYWTISDGVLSITGSGAMYDYTAEALAPWYGQLANITTINLPDGLTSIGAWAFYDCDAISSISIPNTVTAIGNEALYHCSSLTSVSIPNSVTTLGYEAFANCTLLTNVSLGSSVTSIGGYAFSYCPALAKMTLKSETPPTPGDYIFSNSSAPTCYIPCGTLSAYQSSAWATLVASIEEQCYDENYHNFEVDIQNEAWQFVQDGQINYWTIGTAAGSVTEGNNALYITTNGTDYNYNTGYSSASWAYIPVTLETTDTISFYWKGVAESSYDNLRVYLFPDNVVPTAGSTNTVSGAIAVTSSYLSGQSEWQLVEATPAVSGQYNLCFLWKTDGGGGSNPPIAVDDIRIGNTATPTIEPTDINITNAEVTIDESNVLYFYSNYTEEGITYPLTLEVPGFEDVESKTYDQVSIVIGGSTDSDPWLDYAEGSATVTNDGTCLTVSGTLVSPATSREYNVNISGLYSSTSDTIYDAYICYGESYTWGVNGMTYTESGIYTYSDSWTGETTAILNLTVAPAPIVEADSVVITENELPYIWRGYSIAEAGNYVMTEQSIHGCDSILYELYLTVEASGTSGLTYNVTVPAGTSACYIAGDMNGWTFTEMTKVNNTHFTITIEGATTDMTYKYCSGPAWNYVEVDAYGSEISNRTYSTNDVVQAWANIYQPLPTTPASDYHNFEDASFNAEWQFVQDGQTNYWTIGTAAGSASTGSNALYITNNGSDYSYTISSFSISWAYIPVTLETTDTISFSWKGVGESGCDYLSVYLFPADYLPTAGSTSTPSGAVAVASSLRGQTEWQFCTATPAVSGNYNLCFMWRNDGSAGSTPIAVDEVRIAHFSAPANPENQCGDNLYWDYSNGTLTITGSGAMYDGNDLLTYHQQSWFPDEVTRVNLPNGMTHIGATAFADCSNLTSINIPSSVVSIGKAAFAWSGLRTLTLPEGVQDIDNMAFANCDHLTKFIYRGTPNELGNATTPMFLGCNQLDTIIAPARMWNCPEPDATVQEYYGFPSHIRYIEVTGGELSATNISYMANSSRTLLTLDISSASNNALPNQAFINWTALETLRLPANLTEIPYQMAYACENLKAIAIPSYVAVIGDEAFRGCSKLSSIDFADSQNLYSIGQYAFAYCSALLSVEVPEGVQTLGAYAFRNTGLVQLRLPSTLSVIGNYTFYNCSHLLKMNVAAYTPPTVSSYTFYNVPRTAKVYVPESVVNTYKSTAVWREFFIESNVQDAVDNILTEGEEQTQKLFINGQVIIIRNGKSYNLMGQEL